MRFVIEIIFCIGVAYGIGWFYSSYYGRLALGRDNRRRQQRRGGLALVQRLQSSETVLPVQPSRDKGWLS